MFGSQSLVLCVTKCEAHGTNCNNFCHPKKNTELKRNFLKIFVVVVLAQHLRLVYLQTFRTGVTHKTPRTPACILASSLQTALAGLHYGKVISYSACICDVLCTSWQSRAWHQHVDEPRRGKNAQDTQKAMNEVVHICANKASMSVE